MFQYDYYYPSLLLSYSLILSRSSNLGIIKAPTTSPPPSLTLPSNFQLPTSYSQHLPLLTLLPTFPSLPPAALPLSISFISSNSNSNSSSNSLVITHISIHYLRPPKQYRLISSSQDLPLPFTLYYTKKKGGGEGGGNTSKEPRVLAPSCTP